MPIRMTDEAWDELTPECFDFDITARWHTVDEIRSGLNDAEDGGPMRISLPCPGVHSYFANAAGTVTA